MLTNLAVLEGRRGQVPSALDLLKMSRSVLEEGRRRAPEDVGLRTLLAEAHLQTCSILEEHRTQLKEAQASAQAAQKSSSRLPWRTRIQWSADCNSPRPT